MSTRLSMRKVHSEPMAAALPMPPAAAASPLQELLSEREEEIAKLAARGLSNKQIAQLLCISHWTVATHLRRTFLKLDITRRIELCLLVAAHPQG